MVSWKALVSSSSISIHQRVLPGFNPGPRFLSLNTIAFLALALTSLLAPPTFAQAPAPGAKTPGAVKGYTRNTKSGKIITVKGYTRAGAPKKVVKTVAVKGYTRKTKSGKVITVKSYQRTVAAKKPGSKMMGAPKK